MQTLIDYAKAQGAVSVKKVTGPNGAFIAMILTNGEDLYIPVGKKSQTGSLRDFNVLIADDGQAIATVNLYETEEELSIEQPKAVKANGSRAPRAVN